MKVKNTTLDREGTWDRAFGSGAKVKFKGPKQSEFYVQKTVCKYLREHYPDIRFYSTLDGFNLGDQKMLVSSIQWFEAGVPDLFIYKRTKKHTMLVLELKREGAPTKGTDHLKRQRAWLDYLESQGAKAVFAVGLNEALKIINDYLK